MATMLAPHFSLEELNPHGNPLSASELANLRALAQLLERMRAAVGVPFTVDSGHRTAAQNRAAGGVATSEHLTGAAADVVPVGLSRADASRRIQAAARAGAFGAFGQIIVYPYTTGHVHVSLADGRNDGQVLVKLAEGGYRELFRVAVDAMKGAALKAASHPSALLVLLALAAVFILTRGEKA